MGSRPGEVPALEAGGFTAGLLGGMSSPMSIRGRFDYEEALDEPITHSPPSDFTDCMLWKNPVIPERKFRLLEAEPEKSPAVNPAITVTKAKATSVMSSLMIKLTQENIQRFEQQAGLTSGYQPHQGLSVEDIHFRCKGEGLPKLKMPTGDFKEDRLTASAQSTPCGTPSCTPSVTPAVTPSPSPYSSPKVNRRNWFSSLNPALSLPPSEASSSISSSTTPPPPPTPTSSTSISSSSSSSSIVSEMGGNEGSGGGGGERWSLFGSSRPVVQKSSTDPGSESPGGFTLQSYFGLQKSATLEEMKNQVSLDPSASFHAPKIEISDLDGKKVLPRPHKLKHRDMNILTPSGF